MKMIPLRSSNIATAGHDPATQELRITFKSGQTYAYSDVSIEEFARLMKAHSPGSHFHAYIKGRFNERKI